MSTLLTATDWHLPRQPAGLRFGRETFQPEGVDADRWSVQWVLKRNCSLSPRQALGVFASLCALSLSIAGLLWTQGATLVLPFAGLELAALGGAMLLYARHAADSESIALRGNALTVEHASAGRVRRVSFAPAWVRVEPRHGDRSLIELTGQGRRIAIGRFVQPELRAQLADELRWALRRWHQRTGPATRTTDI